MYAKAEGVGIEPTADDPKPPAYGFEVRAGHQTESASVRNIWRPQIDGTPIFSGSSMAIASLITKASAYCLRIMRPTFLASIRISS